MDDLVEGFRKGKALNKAKLDEPAQKATLEEYTLYTDKLRKMPSAKDCRPVSIKTEGHQRHIAKLHCTE